MLVDLKEKKAQENNDMPYEVMHTIINFQNIKLGEKVRKINEKNGADNFKYEFTELNVAKMMHNDN